MAWQYLVGPVLGAFIGWLTNWVAVKMLFRPREEVRFLGVRIQGLIPRRRAELTRRVAEIVKDELISHQDMKRVMETADVATPILRHIDERLVRFVEEQMAGLPGLVRGFIRPDMIVDAKLKIMREVREAIPQVTDDVIAAVNAKVDFKQIIVEKLDSIDLESFESLATRLTQRELRSIELAGAVLGFAIGMVQSLWLWLAT